MRKGRVHRSKQTDSLSSLSTTSLVPSITVVLHALHSRGEPGHRRTVPKKTPPPPINRKKRSAFPKLSKSQRTEKNRNQKTTLPVRTIDWHCIGQNSFIHDRLGSTVIDGRQQNSMNQSVFSIGVMCSSKKIRIIRRSTDSFRFNLNSIPRKRIGSTGGTKQCPLPAKVPRRLSTTTWIVLSMPTQIRKRALTNVVVIRVMAIYYQK